MLDDLIDEIKCRIIDCVKELWNRGKYVIIPVLSILIILIVIDFKIQNPKEIESQQIYVYGVSISNLVELGTLFTIPITAIWAFFQYRKNIRIKQQEKAVEIAEEFSTTLVDNLSILNDVYSESNIRKYMPVKEEQSEMFQYFNVDEIRRIYKDDSAVDKYKTARKNYYEEMNDIYHLKIYFNLGYCSLEEYKKGIKEIISNEFEKDTKEKIEKKLIERNYMPFNFFELESATLNKLEYICMNISSKAADSNFIYQSLHQIFLRTLRNLYMEISIININACDKFYTNIIHVYKMWKNKYLRESRIEKYRIKKVNDKLNPKNKTV